MGIEQAVRVLAGTLVLVSVALSLWLSPWWLLLAVFVGANLIQSAFTGFCPAEAMFARFAIARSNHHWGKVGGAR